jgi:hypothetical protein
MGQGIISKVHPKKSFYDMKKSLTSFIAPVIVAISI